MHITHIPKEDGEELESHIDEAVMVRATRVLYKELSHESHHEGIEVAEEVYGWARCCEGCCQGKEGMDPCLTHHQRYQSVQGTRRARAAGKKLWRMRSFGVCGRDLVESLLVLDSVGLAPVF